MESLISGTSLEALLQESQQHTILLSDIRENSEAARKTDEHSLEQLRKLQQAAADTLEVAKSHKKQSKDESNTLKMMHETTVNANAIVAKRQTSVLNTLCKTVDVGFTVANQKMFDVIEKLGINLANAFKSVGHSLENKLYSFFGELSFMIKPIVGIVKVGFSVLKKIIEVPLKALWEGFKAFNSTIIGKLVTLGLMIWGLKKFFSTKFGQKVSDWIKKKKGEPNSVIGSFFNKLEEIITWIKVCAGAKIVMDVSNFFYKGAGRGMLSMLGKMFKTILPAGFFTFFKNLGKKGTGKVLTGEVKNLPTKRITDPRFLLPGPSGASTATKTASTTSQLIKDAEIVKDASKTSGLLKGGSTLMKGARLGKSMFSPAGLLGLGAGLALDYGADQVDNKTGKGLMQVLSAAIEAGTATAPLWGIPVAGPIIGAAAAIAGAAGSLLFGEGGKNLFGSDDENVQQNTDLTMLNDLQRAQQQASTAEIRSINDVAESIREQNRTMIQVAEKISTDAQFNINRRESTTQEAARHEDAREQQKLTTKTNTTLQDISDTLTTLSSNIQTMLASAGGNKNNTGKVRANV